MLESIKSWLLQPVTDLSDKISGFFCDALTTLYHLSYWIALIACVCSMILYAATEARRFKEICIGVFVGYVLLKGIVGVL